MEYQKKELPSNVNKAGWAFIGFGLLLSVAAYLLKSDRAVYDNLIAFIFLMSVTFGSVILIALEYLAGAVWSTPIRRVTEFIASALPFVIILAIPLLLNMHKLFHWTHLDVVQGDKILTGKSSYLNIQFFIIRFAVVTLIMILFYWLFIKNSQKQDITSDQKLTKTNVKISAVFMPFAVIGLSVMSIDWMMSLQPHWFSTIFGIYFVSGTVLAALGATTYAAVNLNEKGYFPYKLNGDHYYSLGALMFAFTNFWAYIAFSQFLLIWYANIPEETVWFLAKWSGSWKYMTIGLIFIRFVIPYSLLLSQPSKMNPRRLKFVAVWILFSHIFDIYWLIMPNVNGASIISWTDFGFPLLVIGILIQVFIYKYKRVNIAPVGDPKLRRGLDFQL
jgi:hypothetical protein